MHESKDPAIKLFGKKIPLPGEGEHPAISGHDSAIDVEKGGGGGDDGGQKTRQEDDEADEESQIGKITEADEHFPEASVDPKTPLMDEETAKSSKNDDETNSQDKILKKPDQVIPCRRCNSKNTKFCYYNNYNVNQPRHFCKSCQRYWTEGGTMRNVPVGAGRRKTKNNNNSSHYRFVTINEALRVARISTPNGTKGKVLSFGSDSPGGSVLNLADNKIAPKSTRNGFQNQISCLAGVPWPVSPAAFWNYELPRLSTNSCSPTLMSSSSGRNSRKLGKHARDGDMLGKEERGEQSNCSVLVTKTMRIDDPSEAAKSSIWTTLGIKKETLNGGSMFEVFQWRKDGKNQKHAAVETSSVLRANPAALSRSVHFHENT